MHGHANLAEIRSTFGGLGVVYRVFRSWHKKGGSQGYDSDHNQHFYKREGGSPQ